MATSIIKYDGNLDRVKMKHSLGTVPSCESRTYTLTSTVRLLLLSYAFVPRRMGMWMAVRSGTYHCIFPIVNEDLVTATMDSESIITFTNNGSAAVYLNAICFQGDISPADS